MALNLHFVPNTGVQYFDLDAISAKELSGFSHRFERALGSRDLVREAVQNRQEDESDEPRDGEYGTVSSDARLIKEVVEALDYLWLPMPMDRDGVWVAVHLKRIRDRDATTGGRGDTRFRAHLAIDTTLQQDGNPQGMDGVNLGARRLRPCARKFWAQPVVKDFMTELSRRLTALGEGRFAKSDVSEDRIQSAMIALAAGLGLWHGGLVLHPAPRPGPDSEAPIGVDLAIDLGNSRTCVVLTETTGPRLSRRLSLVYPDDPARAEDCPFETQSVFVEHEVLWTDLSRRESFRFASPIQIGTRAAERLRDTSFDPRPFGVSSPKRYLWDESPVDWDWAVVHRRNAEGMPQPIRSELLLRMDVANPLRDAEIPALPPRPNHPRIAFTIWFIIEILEQAFRQANSVDWRGARVNAPHHRRRREIQNLAITYPAGMHGKELRNFRRACRRACRLWAEFRSSPHGFCAGAGPVEIDRDHGVRVPKVHLVCDEGLSIHACWFRGALLNYDNGVGSLLRALGRHRVSPGQSGVAGSAAAARCPTLRLASLDIGGGTIDLAIAEYWEHGTGPAAEGVDRAGQSAVRSQRLFHSGISRAGDDLVRCTLERLVFPACLEQCREAGMDRRRWNQLFSQPQADDAETERLRRHSLRSVWRPLAGMVLDRVQSDRSTFDFAIADVDGVDKQALAELEKRLGLHKDALGKVRLRGDFDVACQLVRQAIGVTLEQCADVIDQFACDLLVVAGRPSSNPAVREQLLGFMPVPPGQVIFLADMPSSEDWYPFPGSDGRISDAKTCGVVGCMVAFNSLRRATAFALDVEPEPQDAARREPIVGVIANPDDPSILQIRAEDVIGADDGLERWIRPLVGARIGVRRIDHPRAEASPVYTLAIKRGARARVTDAGKPEDRRVIFRLEREEREPQDGLVEVPRVAEMEKVKDVQDDDLVLRLNTLADSDGYWLDTGRFSRVEDRE